MFKKILVILITFIILILVLFNKKEKTVNYNFTDNLVAINVNNLKERYKKEYTKNYYNEEHVNTIAKKINKYLNSTLENKGEFITKYSITIGVDPYLASAIILHETGCYWNCSKLTRNCNNVGGNVGSPSCPGSRYRKFDTIEDGIKFAINKINNYYKKGLKTPDVIGPKYASDPKWGDKVQKYIDKIKNNA